ncbi:hypothetical protein ABMA28_015224 [Loxostege sticticalis]|uniref:Gag protein n=1 Tax=Loxostege sticticalis TaxID=481309 RepID=A0ABD0TEQ7_LOXSC
MADPLPTSEVGSDPPPLPNVLAQPPMSFFAGMEVMFKKMAECINSQHNPSSSMPTVLAPFDPDVPESDITNWCALSEMIIEKRKLQGVDLIITLTHSLKGRAATCLTKIQPDKISWPSIKDMLISNFSKPMMMQDHFDQIIKFRLGNKDSPAEAGLRLWQLIERIPDANLLEHVITGFVVSVLSQCEDKIRRELNSVVVNDKHQLFRILRGFSLKSDDDETLQQGDINDHEINTPHDNTSETDTAGSSTLTAENDNFHTASSRTISIDSENSIPVYSEPTIIVTQADVHRANDSD